MPDSGKSAESKSKAEAEAEIQTPGASSEAELARGVKAGGIPLTNAGYDKVAVHIVVLIIAWRSVESIIWRT